MRPKQMGCDVGGCETWRCDGARTPAIARKCEDGAYFGQGMLYYAIMGESTSVYETLEHAIHGVSAGRCG